MFLEIEEYRLSKLYSLERLSFNTKIKLLTFFHLNYEHTIRVIYFVKL